MNFLHFTFWAQKFTGNMKVMQNS